MSLTDAVNKMKQIGNVMRDPQGYITMAAAQQMIAENPQKWQQIYNDMHGKGHDSNIEYLKKIYGDAGMDLGAAAAHYGIQL